MKHFAIVQLLVFLIVQRSNGFNNIFDCKVSGTPVTLYLVTASGKAPITDASSLITHVPTYFMIHGWMEDSTGVDEDIANDLANGAYGNSILVDFKELAKEFYVNCATKIIRTLGDYISTFIVNGFNSGQLQPDDIHLIGQSLGAHAAGYIGRTVFNKTEKKIRRISGLDPAGPLFAFPFALAGKYKLSKMDATFVDVLHTSNTLGSSEKMGKVDVYARGVLGTAFVQSACLMKLDVTCSHGFSKVLFKESINSCGIIAKRVGGNDEVIYGFHMPETTCGTFEFSPRTKAPYGTGSTACN